MKWFWDYVELNPILIKENGKGHTMKFLQMNSNRRKREDLLCNKSCFYTWKGNELHVHQGSLRDLPREEVEHKEEVNFNFI